MKTLALFFIFLSVLFALPSQAVYNTKTGYAENSNFDYLYLSFQEVASLQFCQDSDRGIYPDLRGQVTNGKKTLGNIIVEKNISKDSCLSATKVREYYCNIDHSLRHADIDCPIGQLCVDGACHGEGQLTACYDDDGFDIFSKGTLTVNPTTYAINRTEFCTTNRTVFEYYCSGGLQRSKPVDCPEGFYCTDGACHSITPGTEQLPKLEKQKITRDNAITAIQQVENTIKTLKEEKKDTSDVVKKLEEARAVFEKEDYVGVIKITEEAMRLALHAPAIKEPPQPEIIKPKIIQKKEILDITISIISAIIILALFLILFKYGKK